MECRVVDGLCKWNQTLLNIEPLPVGTVLSPKAFKVFIEKSYISKMAKFKMRQSQINPLLS